MEERLTAEHSVTGTGVYNGDMDLSQELAIVWVRGGPDDYPYLREEHTFASTRAKSIPNLTSSVVAYATLKPTAASKSPGRFQRRQWKFQFGRDGDLSPIQGVKPHSIAAGRRSEPME